MRTTQMNQNQNQNQRMTTMNNAVFFDVQNACYCFDGFVFYPVFYFSLWKKNTFFFCYCSCVLIWKHQIQKTNLMMMNKIQRKKMTQKSLMRNCRRISFSFDLLIFQLLSFHYYFHLHCLMWEDLVKSSKEFCYMINPNVNNYFHLFDSMKNIQMSSMNPHVLSIVLPELCYYYHQISLKKKIVIFWKVERELHPCFDLLQTQITVFFYDVFLLSLPRLARSNFDPFLPRR